MRICSRWIWGMIKMVLFPVGGSRTLCILVFLYFLKIYEHSETCALKLQFLKCLQGWWGWRIFFISQKIVICVVILLIASKALSCGMDVNIETASSWCHLEVWYFSTFLMVSLVSFKDVVWDLTTGKFTCDELKQSIQNTIEPDWT